MTRNLNLLLLTVLHDWNLTAFDCQTCQISLSNLIRQQPGNLKSKFTKTCTTIILAKNMIDIPRQTTVYRTDLSLPLVSLAKASKHQ